MRSGIGCGRHDCQFGSRRNGRGGIERAICYSCDRDPATGMVVGEGCRRSDGAPGRGGGILAEATGARTVDLRRHSPVRVPAPRRLGAETQARAQGPRAAAAQDVALPVPDDPDHRALRRLDRLHGHYRGHAHPVRPVLAQRQAGAPGLLRVPSRPRRGPRTPVRDRRSAKGARPGGDYRVDHTLSCSKIMGNGLQGGVWEYWTKP